jgi:hypothetical protein
MPTKFGRIVRYGRAGPKFVEAFLDSGDRVELSPIALRVVQDHDPTAALLFVERRGRIFHYVQWVGAPDEAVQALRDGVLYPNEVPRDILTYGLAWTSLQPRIKELQKERYEQAVLYVRNELPDGGRIPILGFARFASSLLRLTDAQLAELGRAFLGRSYDAWLAAFEALDSASIRVGFAVRGVRWPDPADNSEWAVFRETLHPAAKASESAAAGLAERRLTSEQFDLLYGPFATYIPVTSLSPSADSPSATS